MEANVTFIYDCIGMTIQCKKTDKMKDICQRYSTKLGIGLKLLTFLYGGKQLDFELTLNETNPSHDETKILVTKNELDGLICPKCGENIIVDKESIDEINRKLDFLKSKKDYYLVLNESTPHDAVRKILQVIFESQHIINTKRLM